MFYLGGDPAQVCNAGGPQALDEVRLREGSLLWPQVPRAARHARPHPDALSRCGERADQRRRRQGAGGALGLRDLLHARHLPQRQGRARTVPDVRRHRRRLRRAALRRRHRRGLFRRAGELPRRVPRDRLSGAPAHLRHPASIPAAPAAIAAAAASCANTRSWPRRRCWPCASTASRTRPGASTAAWRAAPAASLVNPGTNHERVLAPLSDGNVLKRGDVLRIETGGGGGHGHPFDRPPEMVAEDVPAAS